MPGEQSYTFYTYSVVPSMDEPRWHDDGIGSIFFDSAEAAQQAVLDLYNELADDPENDLTSMRLEKVETLPIMKETLLALLNEGVGAIVQHYEIIETIERER